MNLSSVTNGSQGLKKKLTIRALTFALLAVGGLFAVVVTYQQFAITSEPATSKPYEISKEEATNIALTQVDKEPDRDAAMLPNKQGTPKLLHVGNSGIGFIVDENSLSDMWMYSKDQRFLDVYQGHYFWHVDVRTFNAGDGGRGYWYLIDADSGKVIGSDHDYAAFKSP